MDTEKLKAEMDRAEYNLKHRAHLYADVVAEGHGDVDQEYLEYLGEAAMKYVQAVEVWIEAEYPEEDCGGCTRDCDPGVFCIKQ